ncbi:Crp/Fnr family transcriptional regulator [Geoalkalibacter sp.]|uniref:Crp/Fnr family transcriptional regulator n=1 Tax=Geoalkalibacter sp. TaxID=3041440 RepID=UPI00272E3CFE|nr:cyclic nucleotide-binding domain-containing protein [Geoalkalibacter sp.]
MTTTAVQERFRFFAKLSEMEVQDFLRFCEERDVPQGGLLWAEGDRENYAAFILSGRLGIKKKTEFGDKHVVVGTYDPGSVVGEFCLLTCNPRAVSALSLEPSRVLVLHNHKFEELVTQHPRLGLNLLRHLFMATSARLTKSYERIASIF